jgi:hypothetical protein
MRENNMTEEDVRKGNKGKIFGWTFILSLLMAANLAMFLADPKIGRHIPDFQSRLGRRRIYLFINTIQFFQLIFNYLRGYVLSGRKLDPRAAVSVSDVTIRCTKRYQPSTSSKTTSHGYRRD